MPFRGDCHRRLVASWLCLAALATGSAASALESAADRHPSLHSPRNKPAGVPANYILTRNGFFDPSCVVSLRSDETLGADLVVRGVDGAEHVRFSPCAYPRYSLSGRAIAPTTASGGGAAPASKAHEPHAGPAYDGWIVAYGYDGRIVAGSSLSTQWVVPLPPANVGDQDIAFFNDIETTADMEDILQPVLDFSEIPGHWAIESEHCCIGGNDEQSTLVEVSPGDVILGVVTATGCASTGVCDAWTVTTTDTTTGKSTVLNTTSPMGIPNSVNPGALETYGVTSCDMFPASGEETFTANTLAEPDGGVETLRYDLVELTAPPAGFPTCGYGGSTSGNSYTLIFGTSTTTLDAGAPVDGGASVDGSASDGSMDAPADGAGALDAIAVNDGPSSGTGDAFFTDSPTGGAIDASLADSGLDGGVDVLPTGDSGSSEGGNAQGGAVGGADGAADGGGEGMDGSSAGCGCTLGHTDGGLAAAPFGLLLLVGAWRRRTGTREPRVKAA